MDKYVIGLDYGSDSCRAVIVNALNGEEIATRSPTTPLDGRKYCDPFANQYRQHPLDYIEVLEECIREALSKAPKGTAEKVVGMGFDTTGSTPVFTDSEGTPLALLPEFAENPNAMFVLWKDHTAVQEAAEINELAKKWDVDYTAYEGIYSSEWVWAKMLHILREDEQVRRGLLVDRALRLAACFADRNTKPETMLRAAARLDIGHVAPLVGRTTPEEFLTALDPLLAGFAIVCTRKPTRAM